MTAGTGAVDISPLFPAGAAAGVVGRFTVDMDDGSKQFFVVQVSKATGKLSLRPVYPLRDDEDDPPPAPVPVPPTRPVAPAQAAAVAGTSTPVILPTPVPTPMPTPVPAPG